MRIDASTRTKTVSREHPWALSVQCEALISFYVTVCASPHAKCPRDGFLGGLTSCMSAGNNFRGSTNKTSFSFDVKDCLVSQGMLGLSKKVLQAQKIFIIYSGMGCRRFSACLFMLWRNERMGCTVHRSLGCPH